MNTEMNLLISAKLVNINGAIVFGVIFSIGQRSVVSLSDKIHLCCYGRESTVLPLVF